MSEVITINLYIYALLITLLISLLIFLFLKNRRLQRDHKSHQLSLNSGLNEHAFGLDTEIINQFHDSIISTDLQGNIKSWNKGSEILFGYRQEEIIGKNISILHPENPQDISLEDLIKLLVKNDYYQVEINLLHKLRGGFYAYLSLSMIYDDQKNAIGMMGCCMDISERRDANEALKKFKNTLDKTLDCVFMFDSVSLKFTYVNEGALQHIGYTNDELLSMHPYNIKPEYDEIQFRELLLPLFKDEKFTLNFETLHQNKLGELIPVEVFVQYIIPVAEKPHFIAIIRDITSRKDAEKALFESQKFLEKAQQIAHVGHWKLITDTDYVWASAELRNIIGIKGKLTVEIFMNIVHKEDKEKVLASLTIGREGGKRDIEYRIINSNGELRWLHGIGGAVLGKGGEVVEVFGTIQDITQSKKVEEELKESQALLEKAQTLSNIGHWKYVLSTGEVNGSDELFNIFCISREFFTFDSFVDVVHPIDRPNYINQIQLGMEHGVGWNIKHRLITCIGETKWLHSIGDAILDADGKVIELVGTVQDITNQKLIEDEIEKSRSQFEIMFESIPDAVVFVDVDQNIKMLNNSFCRIFGYEKSEMIGKKFESLYTVQEHTKQSENVFKLCQLSYELKYKCKNGNIFNGETVAAPLIAANGTAIGQLAIIRDVSERTQVDAVLRSLAAAGTGLQLDSFMEDALERLCDLYNCEYAFIGKLQKDGEYVQTLAFRSHGKVAENTKYAIKNTPCEHIISGKKTLLSHSVSSLYDKDEVIKSMQVESYFGVPLCSSDGEIIGLLAVMGKTSMQLDSWAEPVLGVFATRISLELERDLASQELQQYREHLENLVNQRTIDLSLARIEAERASAAKSEFLSRMSHELRTPLNAILGFAQILELDLDDFNENQKNDIKEILAAGRHLLTLINEVLDLAKVESGKLVITMQRVSIAETLQQCLSLLAPQFELRCIKIIDNICNCKYFINADVTRLKQVLLNILSNAVKYNQYSGSISLSCQTKNNNKLRINIKDTGNGLTNEEISHLFTEFERLSASNNVEGSGIGLVICKRLVELMGGSMGVDSVVGEGSNFWLEFNLHSELIEDE